VWPDILKIFSTDFPWLLRISIENISLNQKDPATKSLASCQQVVTMNWCVYLLECSDGTFYCGITNDISRRINEHNGIVSGGARYTKGRRPVKIIASIPVRNRAEAVKLEFQVKRISKSKKLELFIQTLQIDQTKFRPD